MYRALHCKGRTKVKGHLISFSLQVRKLNTPKKRFKHLIIKNSLLSNILGTSINLKCYDQIVVEKMSI